VSCREARTTIGDGNRALMTARAAAGQGIVTPEELEAEKTQLLGI
jgi:hypothetical protein